MFSIVSCEKVAIEIIMGDKSITKEISYSEIRNSNSGSTVENFNLDQFKNSNITGTVKISMKVIKFNPKEKNSDIFTSNESTTASTEESDSESPTTNGDTIGFHNMPH